MVGSTGHPFSSMIGNVDLESLAIATQFLHHDDDQDDDDEEEDEEGQEDDHFRFAKNIPTIIFSPCKDTVRRLLWDFNAERQTVPNSHCFNLERKGRNYHSVSYDDKVDDDDGDDDDDDSEPPLLCCQGS